ncbi:MAG: DMT family transporter [Legionellales bacterium]|nr:DMT family transporter [Legionellales bacterium]
MKTLKIIFYMLFIVSLLTLQVSLIFPMRTKLLSTGMLYLILAQFMVALNIVVSKNLLDTIPIMVMMNIRFAIAALVLFPLHFLSRQRRKPWTVYFTELERKDWLFLGAQALCAGVLFNCLMLKGLSATDANVAGIITSALPAMIAIFSWLFLKESISFKKCLCILLATAGLLVIAWDKFTGIGDGHSFFGDAIVLLSLLPEAGYYILTKMHANKLPIFLTSSLLNGINALLLLPFSLSEHWNPLTMSTSYWSIMIILGISAGLFYVFWLFGSQQVDGVMASLSTAIMPIATVLLAWLLLNEALNIYQTLGLSLVLLSIITYSRQE